MTDDAASITRRFHEGTKLGDGPSTHGSMLMPEGFTAMDRENRPSAFKGYPDAPRFTLPRDVGESQVPAAQVLSGAAPRRSAEFDARLLARLLFYSAGVTRIQSKAGEIVSWFRAAPAAGNLHPVEVYVVCGPLGEIPAGIHHFAPGEFSLETVRSGDRRAALAAALADDRPLTSSVSLVLTGLPWSTGWKYTTRGFRHIYWDAGSMLAQTLAVTDAAGLSARVHLGFVDSQLSEELGLDGVSEFPVAVVTFDDAGRSTDPIEPADLVGGAPAPASANPIEFPELTRTQRAGDLADAPAVRRWRDAATALGRNAQDQLAPPTPASDAVGIEALIRRRGSTRMFRTDDVPREVAEWCLGVTARPVPSDFTDAGRTLLSHFVSAHAISQVTPGRHRWDRSALGLIAEEPAVAARAEAQRLCLGQALGGDSAFTAFHCVDLEKLFAVLGDRGYRAAQLEAGLAAGRLQLAAFASGLGGTGLTFFDDAVCASFEMDEACMLVTAVGASDYRSRPGGPPGEPTEMSGFAAPVVERFKARYEKDDE